MDLGGNFQMSIPDRRQVIQPAQFSELSWLLNCLYFLLQWLRLQAPVWALSGLHNYPKLTQLEKTLVSCYLMPFSSRLTAVFKVAVYPPSLGWETVILFVPSAVPVGPCFPQPSDLAWCRGFYGMTAIQSQEKILENMPHFPLYSSRKMVRFEQDNRTETQVLL